MHEDNIQEVPLKLMRMPLEAGQDRAELLKNRTNWIKDHLGVEYPEALKLAQDELTSFFAFEDDKMNSDDPLGSKHRLLRNCDEQQRQIVLLAYNDYVGELTDKLILRVPFKTFQKTVYFLGQDLDTIDLGQNPRKRDFLEINSNKLANIAYQLADVSNFTDAEEKNEVRDDCLNKIKTSKKYQEVEWDKQARVQ